MSRKVISRIQYFSIDGPWQLVRGFYTRVYMEGYIMEMERAEEFNCPEMLGVREKEKGGGGQLLAMHESFSVQPGDTARGVYLIKIPYISTHM